MKNKFRLFMMLICIVALLALAACGKTVDNATAETYTKKAEEAIHLLVAKDFDTLTSQFDNKLKEAFTPDVFAQVEQSMTAAGDYVATKKSTVQEKDGLHIAVLVTEFTNKNHVLTVTFNSSDQIAGLFIQ